MPIEVTVLFKDQAQFDKFLKTNKVEEYTWRKGKIIIDLTESVKEATASAETRREEISAQETPVEIPVETTPPQQQESMF